MALFENGIPAHEIPGAQWRKSSHSGGGNDCVEVAELSNGEFAVRNSRFPSGPALIFTPSEMAAFVKGAKDGEFGGESNW